VDSRARTAGRAVAPDPRPPDGPDAAGAASTSDARVRDASVKASGASRSTRDGADAGAIGPAPRGRHDRLLPTRGAAVGARARRADVVTRAAPRPWRTRCSGFERATAEVPRTPDRRRRAASADAPRARDRRQQHPEPRFWNPSRRLLLLEGEAMRAGGHRAISGPNSRLRASFRFGNVFRSGNVRPPRPAPLGGSLGVGSHRFGSRTLRRLVRVRSREVVDRDEGTLRASVGCVRAWGWRRGCYGLGAWENAVGQARNSCGLSARLCTWPPLRLARVQRESVGVVPARRPLHRGVELGGS
jgi:hypothetical protein